MFVAAVAIALLDVANNTSLESYISQTNLGTDERNLLGPIYVISFAVEAFLLVWLVVAGINSKFGIVRMAGQCLGWLLRLPFLVTIGQHSLWVYTYHVFFFVL